jgi:hypothetical protein
LLKLFSLALRKDYSNANKSAKNGVTSKITADSINSSSKEHDSKRQNLVENDVSDDTFSLTQSQRNMEFLFAIEMLNLTHINSEGSLDGIYFSYMHIFYTHFLCTQSHPLYGHFLYKQAITSPLS